MARLTAAQRRALPKSKFLVPSKAPGPGSYPVPDKAHAEKAVQLAARAGNASVAAKAKAKLKSMGGYKNKSARKSQKGK